MKYLTIFITASLLIFSSCCQEEEQKVCTYDDSPGQEEGFIDQEEQDNMRECLESAFTSKSDIESNLIGTWEIVGYGAGWLANVPQPCGILEIEQEQLTLTYKDNHMDTILVSEYIVDEEESGNFVLNATASLYPLNISIFCEDYMFFNHTAFDGDMYLYEKVD